MALLSMDSFDHYATADILEKWSTSSVGGTASALSIAATSGRRGSGSFRWTAGSSSNATGYVQRTLAPGDATVIVGVAVSPSGAAGANGLPVLSIHDGATPQLHLRLNSDMTVSVVRGTHGGGGVSLGSSPALTVGVFSYLELKVLIANSGGTVDLWVNGLNVLSLTGQDTQNTASATWTSVLLGNPSPVTSSNVSGRIFDYDDLYICDGTGGAPWNTVLGDCRVDARYPTAEGASSAWTPSSGTDNALLIDETAPNDDTDYTSATTVGQTDTFVVQDAPVAGAVIYGVQQCLSMKKMDAGTCTVAPVIRHGTTDYPGANLSPSTSYAYGLQIAQTNPGTSAQWTEADFNAAEFGYRKTG